MRSFFEKRTLCDRRDCRNTTFSTAEVVFWGVVLPPLVVAAPMLEAWDVARSSTETVALVRSNFFVWPVIWLCTIALAIYDNIKGFLSLVVHHLGLPGGLSAILTALSF